jgi:hypothetical protein
VNRAWTQWILAFGLAATVSARGDADEARPSRGFMWSASKDGKTVTLMGTIHVGRSGELALSPPMMRRLRESSSFAIEADVSDAARVMEVTRRYAIYPDDDPGLEGRLTPELKAALTKVLVETPPNIWRCKPWFLANTIVVVELMRQGHQPAFGTEALLIDFARKTGKPVTEIEGIERQLKIFDSAPESLQLEYLRDVVESIGNGEAEREVRAILDAWDSSDFAAIEALYEEQAKDDSEAARFINEKLFDERHPAMLDAIEKLAADAGAPTVAVGVLHFAGPKGLLNLLRERGYTVRRISPPRAE